MIRPFISARGLVEVCKGGDYHGGTTCENPMERSDVPVHPPAHGMECSRAGWRKLARCETACSLLTRK